MTARISAREARARFAEITDRVHYTGEPMIVEKQGRPFVALVRAEDLAQLERAQREAHWAEFVRLAKTAAEARGDEAEPTDEEIVAAVKKTREEIYRERYGGG